MAIFHQTNHLFHLENKERSHSREVTSWFTLLPETSRNKRPRQQTKAIGEISYAVINKQHVPSNILCLTEILDFLHHCWSNLLPQRTQEEENFTWLGLFTTKLLFSVKLSLVANLQKQRKKMTYFPYIFVIQNLLSIWMFYFPLDLRTLAPSSAQRRIFTWCYNVTPGRFNTLLQCLPQLDLISVVIGHITDSLDH